MSGTNPLPNPPVAWNDLKTGQPTQAFYQYVFQLDAIVSGAVTGVALGVATNGLKLLNTLVASSSASLDDTADITAAYDCYAFELENIVPVTNGATFFARVQVSGVFQTTTYVSTVSVVGFGSDTSTTSILLSGNAVCPTLGNSAGVGLGGMIFLFGPNRTDNNKWLTGQIGLIGTAGGIVPAHFCGFYNGSQGAVTGIRFAMSSGNISTGKIRVYGVKTS